MPVKGLFKKLTISLLCCLTVIFMAVKCQRPDSVGPAYKMAPAEGFSINSFSASTGTVDFSSSDPFFNATFSHEVTWFITIQGLNSRATKQISGTSMVIDASNSSWNGTQDGLYFFMKNDQLLITLTVLGSQETKTTSMTLLVPRAFTLGTQNQLLADFNNGTPTTNLNTAPGWVAGPLGVYKEDPPKPQDKFVKGKYVDSNYVDSVYSSIPFRPIEGKNSYRISGLDDNGSFFVCGMRREKGGSPAVNYSNLAGIDPNQVYLNVYVFGFGDPNSKLNFGAQENDGDGSLSIHEPASDDEWQVQINMSHVGWKLISIKYTDLQAAADPKNGGSGDRVYRPDQIIGVTFGLISSPARNYVAAIIDYPIITIGGPFDPTK